MTSPRDPADTASSRVPVADRDGHKSDEASATVVVPIDRIRAYPGNPRRMPNPEYTRIKASIRAHGLDQPLIVTQRPGEDHYTLHGGGNTRLQILHELFAETGDTRFGEVPCRIRPWSGEADVLLAHLRENDLRGPLSFFDKALAVHEAKRLVQAEQSAAPVTQRQLAEALRARGYPLSQGHLSHMLYAVERLLPLIPNALNHGIGRPQVERMRQLERAAGALWRERLPDEAAQFEPTFAALCHRYDGPAWDVGDLRRALEAEIADRAEISIHAVNLALEAALAGGRATDTVDVNVTGDPPGDGAAPTSAPTPGRSEVDDASNATASTSVATTISGIEATRQSAHYSAEPSVKSAGEGDTHWAPVSDHDAEPPDGDAVHETPKPESSNSDAGDLPRDLKSLRARAWTLASRLAQRHGLGELVKPLPGQGLGFLLTDVPDPALVDQLDEDTLAQVSMVWWQLAAAAEMTVAPVAQLLPNLDESSVLRQALQDQDAGLLFSSVWTLDPGHTGYRLWRRLDARSWRDLIDLMETYRALHQKAEASGSPLWP